MKKISKKVLSLFLAVIMAFGALPFVAFAESENVATDNDVTLTATNTVGKLMTDAFSEVSAQGASYISEVVYENDTATVAFTASENAKLVVSVYDDETRQMLDSEVVSVVASETEKSVSFDVEMPDVFVIKAFLLDSGNKALCDEYSRRVDPEAYEEFMSTTVEDFEEEEVINLDDSETNNFIVLADGVKKVPASDSVNVLMSVSGDTYKFINIDSAFKALKAGDIFYLDNGDVNNLTVIKIKSISIDGSTATVVSGEAAATEMFEFIKIGSDTEDADFYVEELGDGVSVEGDVKVQAWEGGDTTTKNQNFMFEKTFKNDKGDSVTVSGGANFKIDLSYKYYISYNYSEISFSVTPSITLTLDIKGVISERRYKLGKFTASLYGANISITPTLVFSAEAQINLQGVWSATVGVQYDTTNGVTNKSKAPSFKPTVKISGQFYIGFDLAPSLSLIYEGLLEMNFQTEIGITIKATYQNESGHLCDNCIDGDINWSAKIYFNLYILKSLDDTFLDFVSVSLKDQKIWSDSGKLADFYFSFDNSKFDWGECPNVGTGDNPDDEEDEDPDIEIVDGYIYFGSYPQSEVADDSLLLALDSLSKTWVSYGYYSGTGNACDGQMTAKDYMKYADVTYNGNKYRAVTFSSYRRHNLGDISSDFDYEISNGYYPNLTCQDNNGYYTNTTYWFKYEPLKWRVLDSSTGLVICETIIDSQSYNNYCIYINGYHYGNSSKTHYLNNYEKSSIREWLNDDFYNTAFTTAQKSQIKTTTLDNSAYSSSYSKYDSVSTNDKVFLLSYDEARNTNYFENDTARQAKGSDYAKCQGLCVSPQWFLRSAAQYSHTICYTSYAGGVYYNDNLHETCGIRPALRLSLQSVISESSEVRTAQESTSTVAVAAADDSIGYSFENCIQGEKYILMNVKNYSEDFTLTEENLYYIDQVTADKNGEIKGSFMPKINDPNSTTLIFGNFKPCEIKITNAPTKTDYKKTFALSLLWENETGDETVTWTSSNEEVLKVDENGNVTAVGKGTATITATVDGTDISDSVTVTVKYTWWQWILIIFLFGWIWY